MNDAVTDAHFLGHAEDRFAVGNQAEDIRFELRRVLSMGR